MDTGPANPAGRSGRVTGFDSGGWFSHGPGNRTGRMDQGRSGAGMPALSPLPETPTATAPRRAGAGQPGHYRAARTSPLAHSTWTGVRRGRSSCLSLFETRPPSFDPGALDRARHRRSRRTGGFPDDRRSVCGVVQAFRDAPNSCGRSLNSDGLHGRRRVGFSYTRGVRFKLHRANYLILKLWYVPCIVSGSKSRTGRRAGAGAPVVIDPFASQCRRSFSRASPSLGRRKAGCAQQTP